MKVQIWFGQFTVQQHGELEPARNLQAWVHSSQTSAPQRWGAIRPCGVATPAEPAAAVLPLYIASCFRTLRSLWIINVQHRTLTEEDPAMKLCVPSVSVQLSRCRVPLHHCYECSESSLHCVSVRLQSPRRSYQMTTAVSTGWGGLRYILRTSPPRVPRKQVTCRKGTHVYIC